MSADQSVRDYLLTRRSVTKPFLSEPGPTDAQLTDILNIANRVPDHGKLAPWRLITYSGEARKRVGERLEAIFAANNPDATEAQLEVERTQFLPAPLTVGVVSSPVDHPKIPKFKLSLA